VLLDLFLIYEHLLSVTLINAALAIAMYYSLRAGLFNLSAAGFMAIGAYTAALLTMRAGTPWLLNSLVAAAAGALLGYVLGLPVMRLKGHYLAMSTLGFGAIVQVVGINWESLTRGMLGLVGIPAKVRPWHAAALLTVLVYLSIVIQRSRIGRAWDAVRIDASAAATMGIDVAHYRMLAFVLSSGIAALGGAFWAHVNRVLVPTEFGFERLTDILVFALLGGTTHWSGPVLGAVILTTMPEWFRAFDQYREFVIGTTIVLVMAYLPGGVVDIVRLVQRHRPAAPAKRQRDLIGRGDRAANGRPAGEAEGRSE